MKAQLNITSIGALIQASVIPLMIFGYWRTALFACGIGASFGWALYHYEFKKRFEAHTTESMSYP